MEKMDWLWLIARLTIISLGLLACQGPALPPTSMPTVELTATQSLALPNSPTREAATAPPTPQVIPSQVRQLVDLPATTSEMLWQSKRFAWSPTSHALAYLGPNQPSDSLTTPLMLAAVSTITIPQLLASSAVGDLTWSPDSSQIAFVAFRPGDQLGTVMVIHADGSGLRDLLPGDGARTDTGAGYKAIEGWWDEHLVVATSCGAGCRCPMTLDLQRPTLTPLLSFGQEGSSYAWSPDHASMVITSGANPQIGIITQNEREVVWLSGHHAMDATWASFWTFFADWSLDSSHILFLRQSDDSSTPPELWVWNIATQEGSALLPGVIAARWAPGGEYIAFISLGQPQFAPDGSWQGNIVAPQGPNSLGVGVYQWAAGKMMTFFEVGQVNIGYDYLLESTPILAPTWSPDGSRLVYCDGTGQAWILSLDELVQYEVPIRGNLASTAQWSPDGKRVAIQSSDHLWVFDVSAP